MNKYQKKYKGIPIIGFVGFSGAGKTTTLTKIIQKFSEKGQNTAVLKHTHHHFDIDKKGKDSYRFRESGARQVVVGSKKRFALMVELEQEEPDLTYLLGKLSLSNLDYILFEGFKHESFIKIEVHRKELGRPWLYPNDPSIVALVTDDESDSSTLPVFRWGNIDGLFTFLEEMGNRVNS
ncbi:MAG TPA: molybdopterin-guanine dinucleotide biosynthesis protein B [Saprospiraceae bacterium]|nr:molybdopterin-guanine dinucleotide biosynthesis protein B [Saprospiraceae bacterium]